MSVDLWSLGVCLFEFVCGFIPFHNTDSRANTSGDDDLSQFAIFKSILNWDPNSVSYSSYVDEQSRHLIQSLLTADPDRRISIPEIKTHAFFSDSIPADLASPRSDISEPTVAFTWEGLIERRVRPPYIPGRQRALSTPSSTSALVSDSSEWGSERVTIESSIDSAHWARLDTKWDRDF